MHKVKVGEKNARRSFISAVASIRNFLFYLSRLLCPSLLLRASPNVPPVLLKCKSAFIQASSSAIIFFFSHLYSLSFGRGKNITVELCVSCGDDDDNGYGR